MEAPNKKFEEVPPEILRTIFTLVKKPYDTFPKDWFPDGPLGWIRLITHICHRWREVALHTPTLWANIPLFHPRWSAEMLKRSKGIFGLTVDADFWDSPRASVEATCSTLQSVGRVREMNFRGVGEAELSRFFPLGNSPAQSLAHLRTLRIVGTSRITFSLSDATLSGASGLRRLSLVRCGLNIEMASTLLSGLTNLRLRQLPTSGIPRVDSLLQALRAMPNLETLDISESLAPSNSQTFRALNADSPMTVVLQHLQTLRLSDTMLEIADLMQNIVIPLTTVLNVHCRERAPSLDNINRIFSALSAHFQPATSISNEGSNPLRIMTLQIYQYDLTTILVRAWPCVIPHQEISTFAEHIHGRYPAFLSASFSGSDWQHLRPRPNFMNFLLPALPLQNLVALDLSNYWQNSDPNIWISSFSALPAVRSLCIRSGVKSFFEALFPRPSFISFPALRFITISNIRLTQNSNLVKDTMIPCLTERYECGVEIHQLTFRECIRLYKNDISLLREVVLDVEWDGVEDDGGERYVCGLGSTEYESGDAGQVMEERLNGDSDIDEADELIGLWY